MRHLLTICLFLPAVVFGQKVFLIGDAGEPKPQDPTLKLLHERIADAGEDDLLVFLGDNIYPKGLPDGEHPHREEMENKLTPQLEVMKAFPGKSYIIPGNHDWAQGRNFGWRYALNMQEFVEEYLERDDAFLPLGGCPGPVEIALGETSVLIILNTQYFLHPWDKPGDEDPCENKSTAEALQDFRAVVQRNKGKHILVVAHHPVYTYGEHNGNFPLKDHLFPLTKLADPLYLPLPVIGSIHPLFRKTIGSIQDNTHLKYKALMKEIVSSMSEAEHVIHAAGHEHSLQLIEKDGHHFIVSGSGSKTTHLKESKPLFGKSENGFVELSMDNSGRAGVKYWGVNEGLLFEKELYTKELKLPNERIAENISFAGQTIKVVASEKYNAGKGKKKWLGTNYRDVWATEIEVPVFDLGTERGGLTVIKKGGGMQTKSLRLEADNGKQYVLRSIEKYPENAMPAALRNTFAQGIVQDQISSSHPYGAFVVPTLAEAAQIYHTNPRPVYIPDDPRLGQFQSIFAGTLAVYEERPNGEAASDPFFGGGKDVEGTLDVLEKLQKDNDHSVDQNFVVRNRLFDMWIGDWDRHDDQWRWAEFGKDEGGNLYRPIPRDRDQAFFINEGIIPKIASRKWALPKIEGFDEEVRWAPGISQNARFFDRTFMSEPDWNDWQEQIRFLQENLTDDVIAEAVSNWPEEIQNLTAERVTRGLKARRADMSRFAREQYLYLAKEVEVVGSDKHEYFDVERLDENRTRVTVYKRKKKGDIENVIYDRTFLSDETKEIRLYGRDGEDVFNIKGGYNGKTKIRIIGGTDKDRIINAEGSAKLKNIKVYDRKKSTEFEGNASGISRLSDKPEINAYDRKAFKYNVLMPLITGNINPDDGLFLGGGFTFTKNAWRKEPYASKHTVLASGAFATGSFNFSYDGDFTNAIGSWSFSPRILWQEPFFVSNYFGTGNETVFIQDEQALGVESPIQFYRVRIDLFDADFMFTNNLGAHGKFYFGPGYKNVEVEQQANRFITSAVFPDVNFETNSYIKFTTGVMVDSRDNAILPQKGTTAKAEIQRFEAEKDISTSFTRLSAEWAFYLSARLPSRLVIANRIGVAHNTQSAEFFNANILGGRTNLRGYRRTRFYGNTSFYHNFDLRLKLFSFRSYIFPGQFGINAFHDTGRVWVDGENSDKWHTGKGFGIWVSPLNSAVLNLNYAFGEDENIPTFGLGFFF